MQLGRSRLLDHLARSLCRSIVVPRLRDASLTPRPVRLPFEDHELEAQHQDFEGVIVPASEKRERVCLKDPESGKHYSLRLIANLRILIISGSTDLFRNTKQPNPLKGPRNPVTSPSQP